MSGYACRVIAFAASSACWALAVSPVHSAPAGPASVLVQMRLPDVQGPVPTTATSRPYLSAAKAMAESGYVEEEYFLSGSANVYDWAGKTKDLKVVAGPGRYVNRILVRRPRDASRFSGNVEVTILNATSGADVGGPADSRRMVAQGDVWIGITSKPVTVAALKRFDPVRYAPLDWSNPASAGERCASPSLVPSYFYNRPGVGAMMNIPAMRSSSETEDGLVWDILGQVGLLLKSEQRHKILPGFGMPVVYMTGSSQSASVLRTWYAGFHDRYRTPQGRPVYDGYFAIVFAAQARLNQCGADVLPDDPRQKFLPPPSVPFVTLLSEGEMWVAGRHTRQVNSATPKGGIITYEVAGAPHGRGETPGLQPDTSARDPEAGRVLAGLAGGTMPPIPVNTVANDLPWAPVYRGVYRNFQLWLRDGVVPPQAPMLRIDATGRLERDEHGNALGGIRMPYIEVPVATYRSYPFEDGIMTSFRKNFSAEKLKALYPDRMTYIAKFSTATDRFAAGGWITPEDSVALKKASEKFFPN